MPRCCTEDVHLLLSFMHAHQGARSLCTRYRCTGQASKRGCQGSMQQLKCPHHVKSLTSSRQLNRSHRCQHWRSAARHSSANSAREPGAPTLSCAVRSLAQGHPSTHRSPALEESADSGYTSIQRGRHANAVPDTYAGSYLNGHSSSNGAGASDAFRRSDSTQLGAPKALQTSPDDQQLPGMPASNSKDHLKQDLDRERGLWSSSGAESSERVPQTASQPETAAIALTSLSETAESPPSSAETPASYYPPKERLRRMREEQYESLDESDRISEKERLRRLRISQANRGRMPWNVGRKHKPGEQDSLWCMRLLCMPCSAWTQHRHIVSCALSAQLHWLICRHESVHTCCKWLQSHMAVTRVAMLAICMGCRYAIFKCNRTLHDKSAWPPSEPCLAVRRDHCRGVRPRLGVSYDPPGDGPALVGFADAESCRDVGTGSDAGWQCYGRGFAPFAMTG